MDHTKGSLASGYIVPRLAQRGRLALLALLALLVACGSSAPSAPALGQAAPDFTLPTLDGQTIQLSQLKGRVVIVNFWATWCPPCENETPRLVAWYTRHRAAGLEVLGVDKLAQDSREAVVEFVERYAVPYPVPLDQTGDVSQQWQALQLPRSYVLDRQGVVRYVRIGELTERDFATQVLPLLEAGS